MAGGGGNSRNLDQTPTWAVASVCAIIVLISILLEKGLHHIDKWLISKRKKALCEALEKVKGELMVLGFISLLLTFGQSYISKICIHVKAADTMLPCTLIKDRAEKEENSHKRRLLWDFANSTFSSSHRILAADSATSCPKGKVPLVSINGLHQLHIFIFFLAIFHVIYSAMTMALGRAKIRRWKEWEKETLSMDYEFSNDPSRFRFAHETSFVRGHVSFWNKVPVLLYFVSFFRQFFRSVRKTDYLAMRHGFIVMHLAPGSKFNFQKYIMRSLEDDFKLIVGISPILWTSAVIFLLLNVHGWQEMFWVTLIPPVIILAVGTKLQAIIATMAIEIQERHAVVQGIPLVQLGDSHFWFKQPQFVLSLIHFSLFQNAFQITYFFWIWYDFGLRSCFHQNFRLIIVRVCLGATVQVMCSYITLPLYALVSQMGSHMKRSIFDEQTSKALKNWHRAVKRKHKKAPGSLTASASVVTSPSATPPHHLFHSRTFGNSSRSHSPSRISYMSDQELSDHEIFEMASPSSTTNLIPSFKHKDLKVDIEPRLEHYLKVDEYDDNKDFSFAKAKGEFGEKR